MNFVAENVNRGPRQVSGADFRHRLLHLSAGEPDVDFREHSQAHRQSDSRRDRCGCVGDGCEDRIFRANQGAGLRAEALEPELNAAILEIGKNSTDDSIGSWKRKMTMSTENSLIDAALRGWKSNVERVDKFFGSLSPEQLKRQVTPGKNLRFY